MSMWPSLTSRGSKRTLFVHPYPHGFFMGLGLGRDGMALDQVKLLHGVLGQLSEHDLLDALAPILGCKLELHPYGASEGGQGEEEDEHPGHGARNRSHADRKALMESRYFPSLLASASLRQICPVWEMNVNSGASGRGSAVGITLTETHPASPKRIIPKSRLLPYG